MIVQIKQLGTIDGTFLSNVASLSVIPFGGATNTAEGVNVSASEALLIVKHQQSSRGSHTSHVSPRYHKFERRFNITFILIVLSILPIINRKTMWIHITQITICILITQKNNLNSYHPGKKLKSYHPDNNGNVGYEQKKNLNSYRPDNNGNLDYEQKNNLNSYHPDTNGNIDYEQKNYLNSSLRKQFEFI